MLSGKILITGGAGTLGRAIIKRATEEKWDCDITIFSRDPMKHIKIRRDYPQVRAFTGDIRDYDTLTRVVIGHDIIIHAAATKHIPISEINSIETRQINVDGSLNVFTASVQCGIKKVIAISTDKCCHAANAYGATKYLMEKEAQEFSRVGYDTDFLLVRYGNVLESTGSVIEVWKNQIAAGRPIKMTDPEMTRFWLSPQQAVGHILSAFKHCESGQIFVPLMPALSIGKLAEYVITEEWPPRSPYVAAFEIERIPLRPGEKIHETLVTEEEWHYTSRTAESFVVLNPTTSERSKDGFPAYTSEIAPKLRPEQLEELLRDG